MPTVATTSTAVEKIEMAVNFLNTASIQESLSSLKVVFGIVAVVFVLATVWFLFRTAFLNWWVLSFIKDFFTREPLSPVRANKRWQRIKKMVSRPSEVQRKLGLIKAHTLLDEALKNLGHPGETVAERLRKLTTEHISNLPQMIEAEAICQDILRDPDYRLSEEKAKEIINVFAKTFVDLDLL